MHLLLLPIEIIQDIAGYLSPKELVALLASSRQLFVYLITALNRLARQHPCDNGRYLTQKLEYVSIWIDKDCHGSVLEWAVANNRIQLFERLLSEPGVDIIQEDSYGVTLLHRLAGQGLFQYMEPLIKQLKHQGADPFRADYSMLTPLHFAACRGMRDAVLLLIKLGANASAVDNHGNTPLHLAAVEGSSCVFSLLLDAGASISSVTRFGWLAIDLASITHHSSAVEELQKLGSSPPKWKEKDKRRAINEFLCLSPCPMEYYRPDLRFLD